MKSKDHVKITRKAIELFTKRSAGQAGESFSTNREVISKGAKDEDTEPIATRATNWHFYKENEKLLPKEVELFGFIPVFTIYPTSEHILKRRIKQLKKELQKSTSDDQFLLMGKVIHHIQDMSTPSHVVPIYHGITVHDPYEKYVSLNIDDVLHSIAEEPTGQSCSGLMELYDVSAQKSLTYLFDDPTRFTVTIDGEEKRAGCELFWQRHGDPRDQYSQEEHTKFDGFGRFTTYGLNFGVDTDDATETKYLLDNNIYREIMAFFIEKAVAETVMAFELIEGLMD